jgi:hypothetical protein
MFDHIAPAFLEEVLAFLVPLFAASARGDTELARQAALAALAAYDVATEQEIRLAAEITLQGFGVLESLAKSMNADLPMQAVLRLRGNANALHRSAHQNQRTLERLRQHRLTTVEAPAPAEATQPDPAAPDPAFAFRSRQERRAAERKAAKQQRQQAERDRLRQRRLDNDRPQPGLDAARAPGLRPALQPATVHPAVGHPAIGQPAARMTGALLSAHV